MVTEAMGIPGTESNMIGWAWKQAQWLKAVRCLYGEGVYVCVSVYLSVYINQILPVCAIIKSSSSHHPPTLYLSYALPSLHCVISFHVFLHFLSCPLAPDIRCTPSVSWHHGGQHWPQMVVLWNAFLGFEIKRKCIREMMQHASMLWLMWNNWLG